MKAKLKKALLKTGMVCSIAAAGVALGTMCYSLRKGPEKFGPYGAAAVNVTSFLTATMVAPGALRICKELHDEVGYEERKITTVEPKEQPLEK